MTADRPYPLNPDYGQGIFRRAVRLRNISADESIGELHDNIHSMRCRIVHDGERVTAVHPEFGRVPLDTCAGAARPVEEIAGLSLATPLRAFFGGGQAARHCSHMYDLIWWTMRQACRNASAERFYEVMIPDEIADNAQELVLLRDGDAFMRWNVAAGMIVSPAPFAGRAILKGLISWASGALDEDQLEAVLILQKAYFVSRARRYELKPGQLAGITEMMRGACWSYTSPRIEQAMAQYDIRDMTDAASTRAFG